MLTKRIIPCLDVKNGQVVKGKQFHDLQIIGDPAILAAEYEEQGADELVLLDINASYEKRKTIIDVVKKVAKAITIPFAVGGGIRSVTDIQEVLSAGADKVSINSAAVKNPELISQAADIFGSQSIIIALDVKRVLPQNAKHTIAWEVFLDGGRVATGLNALTWVKQVKLLGAGELLPTSMDKDGMNDGYDLELTKTLSELANLPIIASGGAGRKEHLYEVLTAGKADAALAASIFHRFTFSIKEVKQYLSERGLPIRIC